MPPGPSGPSSGWWLGGAKAPKAAGPAGTPGAIRLNSDAILDCCKLVAAACSAEAFCATEDELLLEVLLRAIGAEVGDVSADIPPKVIGSL